MLKKYSRFFTYGYYLSFCALVAFGTHFSSEHYAEAHAETADYKLSQRTYATVDEIRKSCGGGDCGGYIQYADELVKKKSLNIIQSNFWPPGMPLLILGVNVFGRDNYILKMLISSIMLWSIALYALHKSVEISNFSLTMLLTSGIFLLPSIRYASFGWGVIYSESKFLPIFLTTLALAIIALRQKKMYFMVLSASAMLFATSFRAVNDAYAHVVFMPMFLVLFGIWLIGIRKLSLRFRIPFLCKFLRLKGDIKKTTLVRVTMNFAIYHKLFNYVLLFALTYFGGVHFYKNYVYQTKGVYEVVAGKALSYTIHWVPPSSMLPLWMPNNSACVVNPQVCEAINKGIIRDPGLQTGLSFFTMISQFPAWLTYRTKHFENFFGWHGFNFEMVFLTLFFLGQLWFVFFVRSRNIADLFMKLFFIFFFLMMSINLLFIHYESRFSLPFKLFHFMYFLYIMHRIDVIRGMNLLLQKISGKRLLPLEKRGY